MDNRPLFREWGMVKYVRIAGGEYRFCHANANHKDQVQPGEVADAAGFIAYDTPHPQDPDGANGVKFFDITDEWSMTLTLGPDKKVDGPAIANLLGFHYTGATDKRNGVCDG